MNIDKKNIFMYGHICTFYNIYRKRQFLVHDDSIKN